VHVARVVCATSSEGFCSWLLCMCVCVTTQHEVEICRSEQPFVIQSRCAESFTSTDSHPVLSPATDDRPLTHDSDQPGPSGLSAEPASDVPGTSLIDTNDIIIKTAPPSSKSMIMLLPCQLSSVLIGNYNQIHFCSFWLFLLFILLSVFVLS